MAYKGDLSSSRTESAVLGRMEAVKDFDRAAGEVLEFLPRRIGFLHWMVLRLDDGKRMLLQATKDWHYLKPGEVLRLPPALDAASKGGTEFCFIADTKPLLQGKEHSKELQEPIRAFLEMPIYFDDGSQYGTLCAIDPMPQPKELEQDLSLVRVFASIIGWLLEMEQGAQQLAREAERSSTLAMTDELTGLPNRRAWNQIVAQEQERSRKLGTSPHVLFIDLDELKAVNDSEGHSAGDALLAATGKTLLSVCRTSDFVARIGGDEFGVLLVSGGRSAEAVKERIRQALEEQGIRCSIGVATRRAPFDLEETIREADEALYEEKRLKKGPHSRAAIALHEDDSRNDSESVSINSQKHQG